MRDGHAELVGPYVLLAEIARGELSTVHLAKRHGGLGFQRLFALKRLKPALTQSLDHAELLLDEARLVSGIQHANIASVLDVGADAGSFVVMEYIEGETLDTLLSRAGREGDQERAPRFILPPIVDVLHALHALHKASDYTGQPCEIVHEAPRARHILVGVDGAARLLDFSQVRGRGVRPSRARSERLKVAYMAPEQALSPEQVDLRADLFIVGVTLWESLTGERLFAADTDEQTFQNLLHRRIPRPSEVGVRPPSCFDGICLRALERDPKNRYASAAEMARELHDEAINQALYATPAELGAWVRRLAGQQLRERRQQAGNDNPSSGAILLDTPSPGIGPHGPPEAPEQVEDNPYATGRIHGGSCARVSLDGAGDNDKTPAFGTRRGLTGPDDDAPTGQRPQLSAAQLAAPGRLPLDERVRAATLPVIRGTSSLPPAPLARPASPVPPAHSGLYGAASQLEQTVVAHPVVTESVDPDQTQSTLFVPALPGARRDSSAPSPGAYSHVEGARRPRPAAGAKPRAKPSFASARAHEPLWGGSVHFDPERGQATFDDESTSRRPSLPPESSSARASGPATRPSRPGSLTELGFRAPSGPAAIPEVPVGVPHRPFSPAQMPSAVGRDGPWSPPVQPEPVMVIQPFAGPTTDSLSPATRDSEPRVIDSWLPRGFGMWLGSAALAAIIMLAAGVGLWQWVATRQLPTQVSETHTAGAPRLPTAVAEPSAAQAGEAAATRAQDVLPIQTADAGVELGKADVVSGEPAVAGSPLTRPAVRKPPAGAARAVVKTAGPALGAAARKQPAGARAKLPSDLPANPY